MFTRSNFKCISLVSFMILLLTACAPRTAFAKSASSTRVISATPTQPGYLEYDQGIWLAGVPPNGSWQAEISPKDILGMGMMQSFFKNDWVGKYTLTFKDGNYAITWQDPQGNSRQCQAKYDADRYVVRLTYVDSKECSSEVDYFLWRVDGDTLHIHLLGVENASFVNRMVVFDSKVWTRVY